jgi:plasmid replication initiation protein
MAASSHDHEISGWQDINSQIHFRPAQMPVFFLGRARDAQLNPCTLTTARRQAASARMALFASITYPSTGKEMEPTRVTMRWVGQVHYQKGQGWVELYWWPKLLPHLTGLKRQFTSYQLQQASALRSAYSWKLLELLTRFESTGWAEYTIEDFSASMDATDKQRADFAAIRRKIIEPAVKELVEKDGWLIDWQPIKAGRKVTALRFEFRRDPQGRLDV